jgi:spoIIIJ-associated protein
VEWVVTTGRTVEEARERALDQLGVDEQDAEFETLQEPQKGLFGRLRAEAQVRARVRPTTPRPKVDRRERRRGERRGREGGDRGRAQKGAGRTRVAAASAAGTGTADTRPAGGDTGLADDEPDGARPAQLEGSAADDTTQAPGGSSSSRRRRRSRSSSRTAEGANVSESTQPGSPAGTAEIDLEGQREAVETFLTELLAAFGRSDAMVTVTVSEEDDALEASVDGTELGLLVGQKGVTLQAVHELVRSMVQRRFVGQSHARVRVDVAGYRARRKEALERFARSVAESVKTSGTAKALDPMNSADRKVVHDAVNEMEGVVTLSEGEDDARRVVIRPA